MADKSIIGQDDKMVWIESDIEKIQTKQNLFIQEYGDAGIFHIAREGIQNSFDELNNPKSNGNKIIISYDKATDFLTIEDNGRGFPENEYPLEIFCTKNQSGSKFFRESGKSSGEFGIGSCVINALSDTYILESFRNKENWDHRIEFKNGVKIKDTKKPLKKNGLQHGTILKFKASEKYFGKGSSFPYKDCIEWIETQMYLPMDNPDIKVEMHIFNGLKLVESHKFKRKPFSDLIYKYVDKDNKFAPILSFNGNEDIIENINGEEIKKNIRLDVAITYNPAYDTCYDSYCNYTNTKNGGVHIETVEKVFCNFMQMKAKDSMSEIQREKNPVIWNDVRTGLVCIVNLSTDAQVRFEGNMKDRIGNPDIIKPISDIVSKHLDSLYSKNQPVFDSFIKIVKENAKARVELQKLRTAVKTEKMSNLSEHALEKYIPCMNSGKEYKELYIVEGNSAGGSVRNALNPKTDAVLLLRGNIINVFNKSISDIMKNEEVKLLVTVMRCGIGPSFDINKLYFDRINIMTDEDVDGFNISSQILALFYYRFPEIIEAGKLFKIDTPLYQLDDKDSSFVHNKREMVDIYRKAIVKRYKLKFMTDKDWVSNDELREFLEDAYTYRSDLINAAKSLGKTNKFLVEIALAYLVLYGVVKSEEDHDEMDKAFDSQKFLREYMSNIQKRDKFKEVIYKDHRLSGIVEGHFRLIKMSGRFLKKTSELIPVIKKYGYEITIKEKGKDNEPMTLTIGEFLDMCQKFYPVHTHRFKGLSEINDSDLKKTALDHNGRMSTRYTMSSARKEVEDEIMAIVHGKNEKYLAKRKDMMDAYKIHRDDIDN